jgi:Uma2 family endonuclease
MAMPEVERRYTVAEVLQFPGDGKRYELIRGELIVSPAPAPRHQVLIGRLFRVLAPYLESLGRADTLIAAPADISWDEETLVQPDLLVVPPEEVTNSWTTFQTLLLAVEVLSPSSRRTDRVEKRRLYREHHVGTYWIVDHESQVVEVWRPGDERPEIVTETLAWRVTAEAPELRVSLPDLFRALPE